MIVGETRIPPRYHGDFRRALKKLATNATAEEIQKACGLPPLGVAPALKDHQCATAGEILAYVNTFLLSAAKRLQESGIPINVKLGRKYHEANQRIIQLAQQIKEAPVSNPEEWAGNLLKLLEELGERAPFNFGKLRASDPDLDRERINIFETWLALIQPKPKK